MAEMDINEVLAHLPQRYPLLMIDRVKECEPGKRIVALKNVSANEPYFPGHFPHRPIMPGVLILEAMAQAAGVLVFRSAANAARRQDRVLLRRHRQRALQEAGGAGRPARDRGRTSSATCAASGKFRCEARVEGKVVAEADHPVHRCAPSSRHERGDPPHRHRPPRRAPRARRGDRALLGHRREGRGGRGQLDRRARGDRRAHAHRRATTASSTSPRSARRRRTRSTPARTPRSRSATRNTIREYVTINRGTAQDAGVTRVGDDNWIMAYVHIAHDCQIGNQHHLRQRLPARRPRDGRRLGDPRRHHAACTSSCTSARTPSPAWAPTCRRTCRRTSRPRATWRSPTASTARA